MDKFCRAGKKLREVSIEARRVTLRTLGDRARKYHSEGNFFRCQNFISQIQCRVPRHDECSYFFRACSHREKKLDVIGFLIRMKSYNVVMRRTKS